MKKTIRFSWINSLIGVALCTILFSFSSMPGAHNFQVYLDDKLVVDQYVDSKMIAPTIQLDPAKNYRQLIVKYNECGRTVTGRTISIKDDKNKVLKNWTFDGASTGLKESMVCDVKDITALKQNESKALTLHYSSKEFPEGQKIASLVVGNEPTTALK